MRLLFSFMATGTLILILLPATSANPDDLKGVEAELRRSVGIDVVLVVDTKTGPSGILMNEARMLEFISSVKTMAIDVKVTRVDSNRVSPSGIISAIRNLDADQLKSRTLLFYYAGHGGTDPRRGHFLRTPFGDLSRSVLNAEIRAKSPRLSIILTDCCSTLATLKEPMAVQPPPPERRAVENLLLQHRGIVDINGSSCRPESGIYQAAFYHPAFGGLFTTAFYSMFQPHEDLFAADTPDDIAFSQGKTVGYLRRFDTVDLWKYDRDLDGFVEWSEALVYLNATVMNLYEQFRNGVQEKSILIQANSNDINTLMSQVSQDVQVFGDIAARTDKPAKVGVVEVQQQPVRRPRFGAYLENRVGRGGAFVEVTGVDRNSPAMKVFVWKNGRKSKQAIPMAVGDTIAWANHIRVRSREDFFHAIETIPEGGELNIAGLDQGSGRRSKYEATVILDRFE